MIDFLIVEDNDIKYLDIQSTILSINKDFCIERVIYKEDAIAKIKKRQYSFVIIDIQLPTKHNKNDIDSSAGVDLIKWIKHHQKTKKCLPPDNILILSEYKELLDKYDRDFHKTRIFAYHYTDDESWRTSVEDCVEEFILKSEVHINKSNDEVIIYSVHGINTNGEWQTELDEQISSLNLNVNYEPYSYQYYPVYSFLIPPLRWKEVARLESDLRHCARRAPNATVHLIGHSFGTYVILEALRKIPQELAPKIGRVILINSVLKSSYNFSHVIEKHNITTVINDCGINDRILILSQFLALGLGMAGRIGFKGRLYGTIINRYFRGGHSDLFTTKRYLEWSNILINNDLIEVDEREKVSAVSGVKNSLLIAGPYAILILFVVGILCWSL